MIQHFQTHRHHYFFGSLLALVLMASSLLAWNQTQASHVTGTTSFSATVTDQVAWQHPGAKVDITLSTTLTPGSITEIEVPKGLIPRGMTNVGNGKVAFAGQTTTEGYELYVFDTNTEVLTQIILKPGVLDGCYPPGVGGIIVSSSFRVHRGARAGEFFVECNFNDDLATDVELIFVNANVLGTPTPVLTFNSRVGVAVAVQPVPIDPTQDRVYFPTASPNDLTYSVRPFTTTSVYDTNSDVSHSQVDNLQADGDWIFFSHIRPGLGREPAALSFDALTQVNFDHNTGAGDSVGFAAGLPNLFVEHGGPSCTDRYWTMLENGPNGREPAMLNLSGIGIGTTSVIDLTGLTVAADDGIIEPNPQLIAVPEICRAYVKGRRTDISTMEQLIELTLGSTVIGGTLGKNPRSFSVVGDTFGNSRLFFVQNGTIATDQELWELHAVGTGYATSMLASFSVPSGLGMTQFTPCNPPECASPRLFFVAPRYSTDPSEGRFVYTSDGTLAGTHAVGSGMVTDGNRFDVPRDLAAVNERAYFVDTSEAAGFELFRTGLAPYTSVELVFDSEPGVSTGFFFSIGKWTRVFDAKADADWTTLTATITSFANNPVTIRTRSGNTATPDGSWSAFQNVSGGSILSPNGRYLQVQLKWDPGVGLVGGNRSIVHDFTVNATVFPTSCP